MEKSQKISNKTQMYTLLKGGMLGNTVEQYNSLLEWENRKKDLSPLTEWGIRSFIPGDKTLFYIKAADVPEAVGNRPKVNISIMLDALMKITMWGEVYESPEGLCLYGIINPPYRGSWKELMPTHGKHYYRTEAKVMLKTLLNENAYNDIEELLEKYPGHVVEFSALERCYGTIPGRNAIIWEVRNY